MKFFTLTFVFLVVFFSLGDVAIGHETAFAPLGYVTVVGVIDGDTIKVDINGVPSIFGKGILVRLLGIDAPEIHAKRQCERDAALRSKAFLEGILLKAKQVDLVNPSRDKYFRIDATVIADGVDVSQASLKNNMAVPYDGGTKKKFKCPHKEVP